MRDEKIRSDTLKIPLNNLKKGEECSFVELFWCGQEGFFPIKGYPLYHKCSRDNFFSIKKRVKVVRNLSFYKLLYIFMQSDNSSFDT